MWDAEVLVQHLAVCDSFFCFCVSCLLNNQQHLRTDTHHIAAVEFNRQNLVVLKTVKRCCCF